ncbi:MULTISPECIES: thiolase family protein [Aneurinibacillus]|uniref:acetyl-CoA C-acetyltransferase n=1 Tax=Aneurinibacillus thermoaerophilus TaxID=143495 RepID=A0A1G7ZCY0_ANETH|nr:MULTISPECIES: thiolase family protein [Aneurinibacillus]AMA73058.1 acetyl-CoA acetyltransferase [Aneurinibacillus sp. XH2]MED0676589.1 thiolase family protein [Aneurinibacillus thermoaerophilus]MED0735912.1 thiolase family protein [Aneurinibacillus thermoaerophilus]MED0757132.1 thiolase family protein [Aneurinibacillus thermoaerophilus]MED0759347.1 thiolase family protein [Aneurinibacillus thermoaerophilus]
MKEAVIVAGARTPVGAFGKSLRDVPAVELGVQVLEGLMTKTSLKKEEVNEIIFGHGYVHGGGLNSARIASQRAGFPRSAPAHVVIKACGSGLKAITTAALTIAAGQEDVVIAGGVESMSNVPYLVKNRWGSKFGNIEMEDALLADGLICSLENEHMGMTAERLAERYGISREEQDKFAYDSHKKALQAIENGHFNDEIVPVKVTGRKEVQLFTTDESVRADINLDSLAQLRPVFKKDGTITAGNACPMNDGAAAVLMMSREKAEEKGLTPLLKVKAFASAGVEPNIMGIGPVPATRKALEKAGLKLEDIGRIELNEAFAAQALAVIKELDLNPDVVNVNGGAIALGHPVGATGAKLTVTLMNEMLRSGVKYGMVTLCMAGGMGLSVIYENMTI